ncbi:MAG: SH3 domain-containing protein [Pyrinomonadaceae bacterium]|nr:SH3 domain-containing protein [Pyrinomonadaceae bacterium]
MKNCPKCGSLITGSFCYRCSSEASRILREQTDEIGKQIQDNLNSLNNNSPKANINPDHSQDAANTIIGGLIVLGVFVAIGFCCFARSNKDSSYSSSYPPSSSSSTSSSPIPSNTPIPSSPPKSSVRQAVIISQNANLRKSNSANGEIIQTIAEGTNVEVVKQQGAWFLVKNIDKSGWLHGNTIRLIDSTPSYSDAKSNYPNLPSSPKNDDIDIAPLYNEVQRRKAEQGITDEEAVRQILQEKGEIP